MRFLGDSNKKPLLLRREGRGKKAGVKNEKGILIIASPLTRSRKKCGKTEKNPNSHAARKIKTTVILIPFYRSGELTFRFRP
jgi:hypothetical protein